MKRFVWLVPVLYILFVLLPIYWLLNMSFKNTNEILGSFTLWPRVFTLENYRKTYGARMEPHSVIHFLVFDPTAPRSLRYGASTVKSHLDAISGGDELTPSGRLIGRIAARLRYDDMRVTTVDDAIPLVDEVAAEVAKTHDAIELMYFGT